MTHELIKANLNLYAVLKNLEDIVAYDPKMISLVRDWRLSIQFVVRGGPRAHVVFDKGTCTVHRGFHRFPSVVLAFANPAHLNRMFDGSGTPIPLRGFTRLRFLTKEFPKLTDRLEYYLKPSDELLESRDYLAMNTRLTLNTAVYAVRELALLDPVGKACAPAIRDGAILLKVLPDGPAAHLRSFNGSLEPGKGDVERPMASLLMNGFQVANDFLNGKTDIFSAVVTGDVMIRGQIPMLDNVSPILDRITHYLK
jgi:hypothetical protein